MAAFTLGSVELWGGDSDVGFEAVLVCDVVSRLKYAV
jgi:hypothetical protein